MKIINARVFDTQRMCFDTRTIFTDKTQFSDVSTDNKVLDLKGKFVVPGFIDMHLHGACGADFLDANLNSLSKIASFLAKNGVTSFTPASMTVAKDELIKAFSTAKNFICSENESSLEGIYVEGPFISEKKAGAQKIECILKPDGQFIDDLDIASGGLIRTVVIAPEADGALDFIKEYKNKYNLSLGHSSCDYKIALESMELGVSQLTHSFNAMAPINHRAPGPVLAAFDRDNVFAELICDGTHIHDAVIRMMFNLFKDRVVMISDSMMAAGLEDGEYTLGGQAVFVKDHVARLFDGTIAGSVSTLYDCFIHTVKEAKVRIEDVLIACTKNPAIKLGIFDKVGSIDISKRADFIVLNEDLSISSVCLRGNFLS
ncbi:MAG: N-acetylglucosamine-6-phosphate deacetylase [Succinivibrio sp.]|nr:N-acetylglucosamine-6-phosphate deacetylase [Succinivibrio sp.]